MARQMIGRLLGVLAFLLCAFARTGDAHAIEIKGKDSGTCGVGCATDIPHFDYEAAWKVWILMGSIVTNAQIKWRFSDRTYLPLPLPPGGSDSIGSIPQAAWKRISLYDVKLKLIGHRKNRSEQRYSITIDLGVPWKPGEDKWSFNVPGSPDWDKLFEPVGPGSLLSTDQAKALFNEGFVVDGVELVDPKMSFVAFHDKLLEGRADWRADTMRRTVSKQIDNVEKLAGLPADRLRVRLVKADAIRKENPNQIPSDLQKLYDKLNAGVPNRFVAPARRGAYQRAREKTAEKGRREVKLLLPGQRADRYPGWKKAKTAELKARKPLPEEKKAQPPKIEPLGPLFTIKRWDSKKKDWR